MNWIDALIYSLLYAYAALGTGYMLQKVVETRSHLSEKRQV